MQLTQVQNEIMQDAGTPIENPPTITEIESQGFARMPKRVKMGPLNFTIGESKILRDMYASGATGPLFKTELRELRAMNRAQRRTWFSQTGSKSRRASLRKAGARAGQ